MTVNNKSVILIKVMTDICYILSSYIEVINYNQFCIKNNNINNNNIYNKNNKHYNKKRRIEKHPFDKFSLNEKESLKLFYLLKRGI